MFFIYHQLKSITDGFADPDEDEQCEKRAGNLHPLICGNCRTE
ncbi:Unknown protein sequence [Pseudomonas syringae pv. maculicola]|nr:Unknown protein sequence [Pseudomonas syringae pv. maculicola]